MNPKDILELGRKVISEEIRGLERLRSSLDENFSKASLLILKCEGKVVLTGIGKSGHVARKIASTFSSTGTPSVFLHPAEALHGDLGLIEKKDVVIAISNSGESSEVLAIVPYLKLQGVPLTGITNNPESSLAKHSDIVLTLNIDKEACQLDLAPTTSSTAA
ncbi:MAG TPA: SIS domain-containing protein, partial [Aquificaceae bacterium]|nr:SIS domain-containing protein [Aquificaceae bacterium]